MADAWARSQGMLFLEASAKTRLGIRQVFMEVVKKMLENPQSKSIRLHRRQSLQFLKSLSYTCVFSTQLYTTLHPASRVSPVCSCSITTIIHWTMTTVDVAEHDQQNHEDKTKRI